MSTWAWNSNRSSSSSWCNKHRFILVLSLWRSLAVVCYENVGRRRSGANDSAMEFMVKQTIDERSDVDTLQQYLAPTWKPSRRKIPMAFEKRDQPLCRTKRFSFIDCNFVICYVRDSFARHFATVSRLLCGD